MIIYGKNPVIELLSNPSSQVEEIYLARDNKRNDTSEILNTAKSRGLKTSSLTKEEMSDLCHTNSHQGIAARVKEFEYSNLADTISNAKQKREQLLLLLLDHLEDPQNLGAIIRTADVLGAHGVVIPKDRAASVTPSVVKASAGAVNHLPVSRVVNLAKVIRDLKKEGVWIVGADSSSPTSVQEQDLKNMDIALITGNEGKGLAQNIKSECDFLVSIPQSGKVSSLNASVATGIMIYEIIRQRNSS
ncbi:MAG: putative TrmH family tRNA/rRNA methyltransferase YacO [Thermodesulfobacteriota bacterium]|nr:MAG: putative TrmH family tRNA/rRNA methyltransferase YacO [Thermodesulfobacteriota bacterium]